MLPEKWRNPPCYAQACPAKGAQAAFCKGRFCCGVRLPRRRSGAAKIARAQRTFGYFSSKLCAANRCAYSPVLLRAGNCLPARFLPWRPVCVARGDCIFYKEEGAACGFARFRDFIPGGAANRCAYPAFCLGRAIACPQGFLPWPTRVRGQGGLYFL